MDSVCTSVTITNDKEDYMARGYSQKITESDKKNSHWQA